ncbi:MAG: hypothetical protein IJ880_04660 [Bacilli bacterium]|nr:hypothetical protein [Bacilli bacterium]MBR3119715.1 hypothetical protein [Oceanobacillus sp.]
MYTVRRRDGENHNLTTLEQHFKYIQTYFNFDLYNAYGGFCIQLFAEDFYANDEVDCDAEFHGDSISNVVSQAINWIDELRRS